MTTKEFRTILDWIDQDKVIEAKGFKDWYPVLWSSISLNDTFEHYRIKPEPTLRPWKPEEVPVGALIRGSCYGVRIILGFGSVDRGVDAVSYVLYIGRQGKVTGDGVAECLRVREHSLDQGKTWLPCGVME